MYTSSARTRTCTIPRLGSCQLRHASHNVTLSRVMWCCTQQKVIDDIKRQYVGRRGRYKSHHSLKVFRAKQNLQHIANGFLPSEGRQQATQRTTALRFTAKNVDRRAEAPAHHSGAPNLVQQKRAPRPMAYDVDEEDAAAFEASERQHDADGTHRYYGTPDAQAAFNSQVLHSVMDGSSNFHFQQRGAYFTYFPPHFSMKGGDGAWVAIRPLILFDPQRAFKCPDGACPLHGFFTQKKGVRSQLCVRWKWARPRRVSGVSSPAWCSCRVLACPQCRAHRIKLRTRLGKDAPTVKEAQYLYRAYAPDVMQAFAKHYAMVVANPPILIVNDHMALTVELARLCYAHCVGGSALGLSKRLQLFHTQTFHGELLEYYSFHQWTQNMQAGSQPTLGQFSLQNKYPPIAITSEDRGVDACGHTMVQSYFLYYQAEKHAFQTNYRTSIIRNASRVLASDHSKKVNAKCSMMKVRFTLWCPKMNIPLLSAAVDDDGYHNAATVLGLRAFGIASQWHAHEADKDTPPVDREAVEAPPSVALEDAEPSKYAFATLFFCDHPLRDAKGIMANIPCLQRAQDTPVYKFTGNVHHVVRAAQAREHVPTLLRRADGSDEPIVLGMDCEWNQVQAGGTTCAALLQLSNESTVCVFNLVQLLAENPRLPTVLLDLLTNSSISKVGVNIKGDDTALRNRLNMRSAVRGWVGVPFPNRFPGLVDLRVLAQQVLNLPTRGGSLENLFSRLDGRRLDKGLGGGSRQEWERYPLADDPDVASQRLMYAAQDAAASLVCHGALTQVLRGTGQPVHAPDVVTGQEWDDAAIAVGSVEPSVGGGDDNTDDAAQGAQDIDDPRGHVLLMEPEERDQNIVDDLLKAEYKLLQSMLAVVAVYATNDAATQVLTLPSDMLTAHAIQSLATTIRGRHTHLHVYSDDPSAHMDADIRVSKTEIRPPATAGDCAHAEMDGDDFDVNWASGKVKYDPRHWIANFFLLSASKGTALYRYFCRAVSKAMFIVYTGDRDLWYTYLRTELNLTPAQCRQVRAQYFRQRCRYSIPPPRQLYCRLLTVYNLFKDLVDPKSEAAFFVGDYERRFKVSMDYIKKGFLSDPPTMELYIQRPQSTNARSPHRYYCLRGSSQLEGYHTSLRCVRGPYAAAASAQWLNALQNAHDFNWVVTNMRLRNFLPRWVEHSDLELIDRAVAAASAVMDQDLVERTFPGWTRLRTWKHLVVEQGTTYTTDALRVALAHHVPHAPAVPASASRSARPARVRTCASSLEWMATAVGIPGCTNAQGRDIVTELLRHNNLGTSPQKFMQLAAAKNKVLTIGQATSFLLGARMHDAAFALLKDKGFEHVYQKLHTTVHRMVQKGLMPPAQLPAATPVPFATPAQVPVRVGAGGASAASCDVDHSTHPPVAKKRRRRLNLNLRNLTEAEHLDRAKAQARKKALRRTEARKRQAVAAAAAAAARTHAPPETEHAAGAGARSAAGAGGRSTPGAGAGAPSRAGRGAGPPAPAAAGATQDPRSGAPHPRRHAQPLSQSRVAATGTTQEAEAAQGLRGLASSSCSPVVVQCSGAARTAAVHAAAQTSAGGTGTSAGATARTTLPTHTSETRMLCSFTRRTGQPMSVFAHVAEGCSVFYNPSDDMTQWLYVTYRGRLGYVPANHTGAPREVALAGQQTRGRATRAPLNSGRSTRRASSVIVPEQAVTTVPAGTGHSVPVARLSTTSRRTGQSAFRAGAPMKQGQGNVDDTCSD